MERLSPGSLFAEKHHPPPCFSAEKYYTNREFVGSRSNGSEFPFRNATFRAKTGKKHFLHMAHDRETI